MKQIHPVRILFAAAALNVCLFLPQVHAAVRTWSGGGADAKWSTPGNWGGTAPVNGDSLIFNGTTQQNSTNDISNLSVGSITFSNGGFNLQGNALTVSAGIYTNLAGINIITLNLTNTVNNTTWNLATGSELQLAGAFIDTSSTTPLANLTSGGTLRITSTNFVPTSFFTQTAGAVILDGAVVNMQDGYRLRPPTGNTAVFQITNNASFTIGLGGNLRLCQTTTGGSSRVDMASGILNVATTSGGGAGDIFVGEAANTTTVFNQNGGLVEFTGNGNNRIAFANASATANGTYNLNGGVLWTKQVTQVTAGSPGGTFNFNGGTLKPTTASATFFQGVQTASVQAGGAIIDTTNLNITIGQALPGIGGLTKLGTGMLTLSGANSYTGTTTVSNGDLIATTASIGAGAYAVADGAELDVQVAAAGKSLTNSSLTLGASGSLTNNFILGANASTTVPAVMVVGALNLNGTVNVTVTGSGLTAPNTYLLMSYGSTSGSGSFVAGTLPAIAGYVATLTNNTAAKQLQLVYAPAPQAVQWAVGDGSWDTTSLNWTNPVAGGGLVNYTEGSPALFDDSATGSSPITVTLAGNRSPSSITNNSSAKNYILAGSFSILGSLVTQNGNGALVIDNGSGNTFSAIAINAGTLQLGNHDTGGSLGTAAIANNGTLAINRTDNPTVVNVISGAGGVSQNGSGSVTLSGANTYAGTTAINAGAVIMGNASAVSTNTITIASGGTLDINGFQAGNSQLQPVIVAGSGVGGMGAIFNSSYNGGNGQNNAFRSVTLTGDTTIGGGGTIGLRTIANSDPGLIANGYNLVIKMTNNASLNLNGGTTVAGITNTWFTDIGNIDIQQGTLSFQRHAAPGNPTNTITVESGATLALFSLTPTNPVPTNTVVLNNATLQGNGGTVGDTNTFGGSITLNGTTNAINSVASTILALNGPILGTGDVTYGGTVRSGGVNTYTGKTVINSGTLQLTGSGSLANSASIAVNGGATFDVSGLAGTFALSSSQVLSNLTSTGIINGNANTASGTVGLTYASGTPSLAVANGALTLSGSTTFNVNNTGAALASGNYKIIAANGGGSVAGTLPPVTVGGSGLAAGQHTSLGIISGELYLMVTNHAPVVASIVTNSVTAGTTWKMAIADLKTAAGWSDPDGDAVSLSSVNAASFNGTNLSSDAAYIYYNGAVTAEDHFDYVITDGNLMATNTVYLEAVAATAPSIGNPTVNGSGHPTFSGSGIIGYTYGVESATSLGGPWINAGTVTAGADGSWSFTDASQTNPTTIFYRLYYPYSAGSPPQ